MVSRHRSPDVLMPTDEQVKLNKILSFCYLNLLTRHAGILGCSTCFTKEFTIGWHRSKVSDNSTSTSYFETYGIRIAKDPTAAIAAISRCPIVAWFAPLGVWALEDFFFNKAITKPFSWKAGALFLLSGVGMTIYFQYEKARMERKRIANTTKGVGKPKVGGKFELVNQDGHPYTDEDMKGKYALVYFGFTHCPDICPEELDKMAEMIDLVQAHSGRVLRPIFITCDPARDTPPVIKSYLKEFHPALIGLTGTWEQIKSVCKAYRVYFSTPPNVKPGQDYLVDHNPEGDFVEAIGRQYSPELAAKIVTDHISDWRGMLDKS
ncbi:hypothetical protein FGG08_006687 [Glutinoglossum americanum]|uniref:Thioredoxin domain-containing protein n=1 Tax=Glutinoglossum americanum TaxID=1670608 RepID=A0A9P8HVJ0_9PEZI|nr:hypothetical protein FGG08_006687 [Glutinoglossum americanum]